MSILRTLSIPLLIAGCTFGLVLWAFPEEVSTGRMLGIVLGWAGCSLLLVALLLMLRETWLARGFAGLERMYRWHHWVGMAAYVLLLAHPLALAAAAWQESRLAAWQTLSPFSQGWPVWVGWLSLLFLMLGLAATFATRLPYRTWRWLHIGLGVAVLLGLAHLILLGIDEPVLPILALAALLLGWRVIRADFGTAARPYVVQSAQRVAADMVEISLAPLGGPVAVTTGQFVLVAFFAGPGFRGCGEFHPFTVSSVENGGHIRIAVKALGDCTRHIQSVGPGVTARVHGGFGEFLAHRPPLPQFWIAGGTGITPFLAVLREGLVSQPTRLLYLYRSGTGAAFVQELQDIAHADPHLSLQTMQVDNPQPDLDALLPDAHELSHRECYLCGPPGMIAALKPALRQRGITPRHIHFENFGFR
ncbi:MAG: ferric reductase-like transmembrane domain-containing protein [Nitrosomonadales bacterium]|nr:ferric reductase-like transmembrane domain-containing protein [Nitrosomonadales bacterium]